MNTKNFYRNTNLHSCQRVNNQLIIRLFSGIIVFIRYLCEQAALLRWVESRARESPKKIADRIFPHYFAALSSPKRQKNEIPIFFDNTEENPARANRFFGKKNGRGAERKEERKCVLLDFKIQSTRRKCRCFPK